MGWTVGIRGLTKAMHAYNAQYSLMQRMGVNPDWYMQSMLKMSRLGNVGATYKRGSSKIQNGKIDRDLMKCLGKPSIPEPYITSANGLVQAWNSSSAAKQCGISHNVAT